jgi:ribosomal protein S18 acetylase RimI-like enzyme
LSNGSDAARFGVAVHAYVRAVAGAVSEVVRAGPFTVLLSPTMRDPSWNYAIPDDGASPASSDVDALAEVFSARGLETRVELVPVAAPQVGPSLLRAGFRLLQELPLMACEAHTLVDLQPPPGITVRAAESSAELRAMAELQHDVFGDSTPVTDAFVARRSEVRDTGGILLIAEDGDGTIVGAGMCPPEHERIREIVGVATLAGQRRRGIAGAVIAALTRAALQSGCTHVYLEAARGADGAYRRAGFRTLASVAHYAR